MKVRQLVLIGVAIIIYLSALTVLSAVGFVKTNTVVGQIKTVQQSNSGLNKTTLSELHQLTRLAQADEQTAKDTETLLTNGKTTSAISAKKTEQLAEEIKTLLTAYHDQTAKTEAQQVAGAKELPVLLKQIENNIAAQDSHEIATAIKDATTAVEQYLATHKTTTGT